MAISLKVEQGSYTGDGGVNQAITSLGYTPKVLMVHRADGDGETMWLKTSEMDTTFARTFDFTNFFADEKLQLDASGFTTWLNTNGELYYWLAFSWDADNEIADLVSWTGDGNDNRDIATTVTDPALVFVMSLTDNDEGVIRTTAFTGDSSHRTGNVLGTILITDGIQGFGTNTFQIGSSAWVNELDDPYTAIVLGACDLLSVFTYTGNGADGRNLATLGIDPDYVYIHRTNGGIFDSNGDVHKYAPQTGDEALDWASTGGIRTNRIQAFISGGVQLGSDNQVNANTEPYYGFALVSGLVGEETPDPEPGPGGITPDQVLGGPHIVGSYRVVAY